MTKREGFNEAFTKLIREEEDIYEAHWREKIAKDIESFKRDFSQEPQFININFAAAIVRKGRHGDQS